MQEYSAEEHLAARLHGLESPAELYDAAVLRNIHILYHQLQLLNKMTQDKTSWSETTKQRIKHIFEFFITDVTNALSDEILQNGDQNDDSS